MKELSAAQKLDIVLTVITDEEPKTQLVPMGKFSLHKTTGGGTKFADLIRKKALLDNSIGQTELGKLLDKLVKDKHIEYITFSPPAPSKNFYVTTLDGLLFIGYEKTAILQDEEVKIAQNNALEAKTYANRLLGATWCAGIAAALLLLWQVWIWLYPVHKDYPYWFWEKVPVQKHVKKP